MPEQIKLLISLYACSPISRLPSNITTMIQLEALERELDKIKFEKEALEKVNIEQFNPTIVP